ncbi:MAG: 30S ribosomal protein S4 [Chloroflexi bacterium]|nr:30S ribosomal protein S4 [Chloroflexota bacterium]
MARYTGPVCRLCRRVGEKLSLKGERCLTPKCAIERRSNPPGMHGASRRRRVSEYGLQLREKNKARAIYGVLERQFRIYFAQAGEKQGMTGANLLQILERRLDNVVYRLGFGESRAQARQVIGHRHLHVNGRRMDIPSYLVKVGDVIEWTEKAKKTEAYKLLIQDLKRKPIPDWLSLDTEAVKGTVQALPVPRDMDVKIEDRMIVEYYAR